MEDGVLQPEQRMVSTGVLLCTVVNEFTYWLKPGTAAGTGGSAGDKPCEGKPYMNRTRPCCVCGWIMNKRREVGDEDNRISEVNFCPVDSGGTSCSRACF
ncbi:hypothetical protein ACLBOM_37815 [Escherichia coli]